MSCQQLRLHNPEESLTEGNPQERLSDLTEYRLRDSKERRPSQLSRSFVALRMRCFYCSFPPPLGRLTDYPPAYRTTDSTTCDGNAGDEYTRWVAFT